MAGFMGTTRNVRKEPPKGPIDGRKNTGGADFVAPQRFGKKNLGNYEGAQKEHTVSQGIGPKGGKGTSKPAHQHNQGGASFIRHIGLDGDI